jgi:hypothetical protein
VHVCTSDGEAATNSAALIELQDPHPLIATRRKATTTPASTKIGERFAESPAFRIGRLRVLSDAAVFVQEQDPHGPSIESTLIIGRGADRQVRNSITVEVAQVSDRRAEFVSVSERAAEGGIADFLIGVHPAVIV